MISCEGIKILQIIIGLNVGGAELMLKRLVNPHIGHENPQHTLIFLTSIGIVRLQLNSLGIDVDELGMRSAIDIPRAIWHLKRWIRAARPHVVQTWMYHADLLGGVAVQLAGNRKVVWGIRTTDVAAGGSRASATVRQRYAWLSRSVPHTIVCAAVASRRAHIAVGFDAARMLVVPNGFDLSWLVATQEQREALRLQCGLDAELVTVGYLGRFHRAKDQENFVRAAGLVAQQYNNARFLMVGATWMPIMRSWRNGYALRGVQTALCCWVNGQMCRFAWRRWTSFAYLHARKAFPMRSPRRWRWACPVSSLDVGDAAMLVVDTGVVVPKEDSAALAAGLGQLLAMSPDARQQLGQTARARIRAEFSIDSAREHF